MRRIFIAMLCILVSANGIIAQTSSAQRKKVAVVLSGGGAKGAAHASALKVIEEAGIPVDMVVGTSMGALIGGLYSTGYNADQIDSIVRSQKWKALLTGIQERTEISLSERILTDKYALSVHFDKSPTEIIEGGILKGNNVSKLIAQLTADYQGEMDYSKLKIPFACVATDIVDNKEVDMLSGNLAESLRASMSIPGVFPPVKRDSLVLVDGGMTNNYPVDLARQMGADYVIGVTLNATDKKQDITSTQDVLGKILDNTTYNKYYDNIRNTDVHIQVDVTGYTAASFTDEAIDTLLLRGQVAARDKWDELVALRKTLGIDEPLPAPAPRPLPANMYNVVPPSSIYKVQEKINFIGAGFRFDNEEHASILLGGKYELNRKSHLSVGLEARLGQRIDATLYSSINLNKNWTAQLSYNFYQNDCKLYQQGKKTENTSYKGHRIELGLARSWHNLRFKFGGEYSYYHFSDLLVSQQFADLADDSSEPGVSYFARLTFDNRDHHTNARRGMEWSVGYRFFTDNGYKFEGGNGLHIIDARWNMAISLSKTTILTPYVSGRFVGKRNDYFTLANAIGGVDMDGHYMPQQLSFAGINHLQITKSLIAIGGIKLRQDLFKKHYAFAVFNYGYTCGETVLTKAYSEITNRLGVINMYGAALGYGISTPIGPVEFNLNWSSETKKVGAFLNIGYMF